MVCPVAVVVVVLCLGFDLYWIFSRARMYGSEILQARNALRFGWPMWLALIGATLAVIFAGEYGC